MKTTPDILFTLDKPRLAAVAARRARAWLLTGPLLLAALLAAALCLVHPADTAVVSIAVQQPSGVSPLSLLSGGAAPSKRYLGILKSQWAADRVEGQVHLQRAYGLPSHAQAVKRLIACIKPDDSATDGLLYIRTTLPAPPFAAPAARRAEFRRLTARVADAYAAALQAYYVDNDTDKDAALLRGADQQLRRAQSDYDDAFRRLNACLAGAALRDPRALAMAVGAPGAADGRAAAPAGDAAGLDRLYASLSQVSLALRSGGAEQAAQERMLAQQLRDPMSLPSEDPLLTAARARVAQDQNRLAGLSAQFGPDNPQIVLAQSQLQIDRATLGRQVSGVARALTTPQVQSLARVQGLRAEQASLTAQIDAARRQLPTRRALSGELTRRQAELAIRFEVLKTTMAEAAKVRLENTSSKSRITVVDAASLPDEAQPGMPALAALCLAATLLLLAVPAAREYLALGRAARPSRPGRAARRYRAAVVPSVPSAEPQARSENAA